MADKDLRKLGRSELLEVIKMLQDENHTLERRIKELEKQLDDKRIIIQNAGSIAEASMQLNKIFEVAQETANQYINSVNVMYGGGQNDRENGGSGITYARNNIKTDMGSTGSTTARPTGSDADGTGIEFIDD